MDPQWRSDHESEDEGTPQCKRAPPKSPHLAPPPRKEASSRPCAARAPAPAPKVHQDIAHIQATLVSINGRLTALEHTANEILTLLKGLGPSVPRTITTGTAGKSVFKRYDV